MRSDLHDIEVIFHHKTDKAVLVAQYEGADPVWVPLSQCEIEHRDGPDTPLRRRCVAILTAPASVLEEKGLA